MTQAAATPPPAADTSGAGSATDVPFRASTGHMDDAGPPPVIPETAVHLLSDETRAAFDARATQAAVNTEIRLQLMALLARVGDIGAKALLGL